VVRRFGVVVLVLVLSVAGLGFRSRTQTGGVVAPIADPESTPLDVVTSSVLRGLASLHSPRIGFGADEEWRAEIRRAADDLFDVDGMARRALGPHWKGLLPGEQREFSRRFGDILTQSFVAIMRRHTGGNGPPPLDEEIAGAFAQVRSRITPEPGSEVAIEYRLSRSGSHWLVYDILFDGVSLVSNYRSQFNTIIGTSGVAQLLERMRAEPVRRPLSGDAAESATTAELATSARGRLAAGLLLGAYARWR
jgi:phospholipid transport system substrate-binding protein